MRVQHSLALHDQLPFTKRLRFCDTTRNVVVENFAYCNKQYAKYREAFRGIGRYWNLSSWENLRLDYKLMHSYLYLSNATSCRIRSLHRVNRVFFWSWWLFGYDSIANNVNSTICLSIDGWIMRANSPFVKL